MVIELFWFSFCYILFTYLGYPLLLLGVRLIGKKPVATREDATWPKVSIVIAAKNEAAVIKQRISNLTKQDYPREQLEIVVISDGSTDETNEYIEQILKRSEQMQPLVRLFAFDTPVGKPSAVNKGVELATGEYIVFADARQSFDEGAVKALVRNFTDPEIGCVSGELLFVDNDNPNLQLEMGLYWSYEKAIRKLESETGSVMGATGAIYSIRKNLYRPLPAETILDDVLTPIHILSQGFRVLFEPAARAYDTVSDDMDQEWHRKVRTLTGNWQLFTLCPLFTLSRKNRFFLRLFSHKIARLFVPLFLVILLITSFLSGTVITSLFGALQLVFYTIAFLAHCHEKIRQNLIGKLAYFFCVLNCAVVVGFVRWLSGKSTTVWSK